MKKEKMQKLDINEIKKITEKNKVFFNKQIKNILLDQCNKSIKSASNAGKNETIVMLDNIFYSDFNVDYPSISLNPSGNDIKYIIRILKDFNPILQEKDSFNYIKPSIKFNW